MIFRYKAKFISDIEQKIRKLLVNIAVAPFAGVWIEIRVTHLFTGQTERACFIYIRWVSMR